MYCIVLSMMLFPYGKWKWCFSFKNLQACGYHFPPSVDKEGFPCLSNSRNRKRSEANVFLSGCEYRKDFPVGRPNCHPSKPCHLGTNFGQCLINDKLPNPLPTFYLMATSLVCTFLSSSRFIQEMVLFDKT
jgi:hypothetical protein